MATKMRDKASQDTEEYIPISVYTIIRRYKEMVDEKRSEFLAEWGEKLRNELKKNGRTGVLQIVYSHDGGVDLRIGRRVDTRSNGYAIVFKDNSFSVIEIESNRSYPVASGDYREVRDMLSIKCEDYIRDSLFYGEVDIHIEGDDVFVPNDSKAIEYVRDTIENCPYIDVMAALDMLYHDLLGGS